MRNQFDWIGMTALALGILLGGGWAAAVVISAISDQQITSEGLAFLNNLGQTLATGVVAFLGYKVGEAAGYNSAEREWYANANVTRVKQGE